MAVGKTKSTFPDCPVDDIPEVWMSIDPAAGKKPTVAVLWERAVAKQFVNMNHDRLIAVEKKLGMASLIVMEGGGFMSANAASSLKLERVRGRFEALSFSLSVPYVEVSPDQWRGVLELSARPRRRALAAQRQYCRILGRPGTMPGVAFASEATNDDKRAALLIGWAAVNAWGWI